MILNNFLQSRKSTRQFKNKKVSPEVLDKIIGILKDLELENPSGKISFKLYEYGENIYNGLKGLAGYSGVMIESPHYITVDIKNKSDKDMIYSAYYMEKLVTALNNMNIASCWVSVYNVDMDRRKAIFGESTTEVNFVLAIGYPKRRNPFIQEPFSERIGVEEIVYSEELGGRIDMEYLEERGLADVFYYLRFAPSIKNAQPWRFIIKDDKVHLLVKFEEGENPPLIDAGIAMYYFEKLMELEGTKNSWKLLDGFLHEGNTNYKYIAEYQL
ncbi:nitroreductase [Tissierella creatinini]|nr:nitroreductase [Tissierella creatinini]TJX67497.1 nitroreductase [Soehngenia saccharolytica]